MSWPICCKDSSSMLRKRAAWPAMMGVAIEVERAGSALRLPLGDARATPPRVVVSGNGAINGFTLCGDVNPAAIIGEARFDPVGSDRSNRNGTGIGGRILFGICV